MVRMLLKAQPDTASTNLSLKDGRLGDTLNSILADIKPEAVYFYVENGQRTAQIIFDLQDQADLPKITEPWFLAFGANVTVTPVLNGDDFVKAGPSLGDVAQKYG